MALSCGIRVGMTAGEAEAAIPGLMSVDPEEDRGNVWNPGSYPDGWRRQFSEILIGEVDYGGEPPKYVGFMADEQGIIRAVTFGYPTAG